MYIVGFNGPPRSGKDTMARMLAEIMDKQGVTLPVFEVSLSTPLRKIAYAMTEWVGKLDGPDYEKFKVTHFPAFDKDGRQIMIDISERFLKPCYGNAIMAKMLYDSLQGLPCVALVRDCGFQIEQSALAMAVGAENFYVAQVYRSGTSFENDSREWVEHENMARYPNDGSLVELRCEAQRLYGRLVNQMGWKL